jgi:hypothetical protein
MSLKGGRLNLVKSIMKQSSCIGTFTCLHFEGSIGKFRKVCFNLLVGGKQDT